jgi:hypothetical protein
MAKSSTERTLIYIELRKKLGMKEWRVWVTPKEKDFLKEKLKQLREKQ